MIEFIDKKKGKVIIYEPVDFQDWGRTPSLEEVEDHFLKHMGHMTDLKNANVIGIRDTKKRNVRITKNRFGPLEDYETEQFILNYVYEEEKIDPIDNRFDILDL